MSVFYSAAIAAFVVLVVCILLYFVVAMIEGQLSFDLICQLLPWLWNLSKGERLRLFCRKVAGCSCVLAASFEGACVLVTLSLIRPGTEWYRCYSRSPSRGVPFGA